VKSKDFCNILLTWTAITFLKIVVLENARVEYFQAWLPEGAGVLHTVLEGQVGIFYGFVISNDPTST